MVLINSSSDLLKAFLKLILTKVATFYTLYFELCSKTRTKKDRSNTVKPKNTKVSVVD